MNITILKSVDEAVRATGLTVIIDVFRAFSTEMYIFNQGARYIIPVQTLDEAYALKKNHPEYVLVGERGGIKPEGFDYGNSPTEIQSVDFTDKVVVHTTSNGTKGLLLATGADEVLTGSFINAAAIVKHIKKLNPKTVSLVSTSPNIHEENNEDLMLAYYLRDCLEGKEPSEDDIKQMMKKTTAYSLLFNEVGVPATDFDLCLDFNRMNFVVKQEMKDGQRILIRVEN